MPPFVFVSLRTLGRLCTKLHLPAFVVGAVIAAGVGPAVAQNPANANPAPAPAYSEDEVKAAFLYNFGTYVQWPAADSTGDTISIAVLDAPAVADELERFVQGRTIQGMSVRVRRLQAIDALDGDEVLFIGSAQNRRLSQLIERVSGSPTLVVTDAPDGLEDGAMINFRLVDRRVRFEVSVPRAQDAGLMLSSRLLSAALRVETTRRGLEHRMPPVLADTQPRLLEPVPSRRLSASATGRNRYPSRI